jgi:hypothetical protein
VDDLGLEFFKFVVNLVLVEALEKLVFFNILEVRVENLD